VQDTNISYYATKALRQRLVEINGGVSGGTKEGGGYATMLQQRLVLADGRKVSPNYVRRLLVAVQSAPLWFVIAATRVAEEDYAMTRKEALAAAGAYFEARGGDHNGR
jgi:hypothetical protein